MAVMDIRLVAASGSIPGRAEFAVFEASLRAMFAMEKK
jgi:hypothetical protein